MVGVIISIFESAKLAINDGHERNCRTFAHQFKPFPMKGLYTILLLIVSNVFMTFAWYGQLKLLEIVPSSKDWPLFLVILVSWGVALFEYSFMIPANRIGAMQNGGPFNLIQLKVIQEAVSLTVFTIIVITVFKTETFRWNHIISFIFIILAVFFAFKK